MDGDTSDPLELTDALPERIGRYLVLDFLGHGGFGTVYLAADERLQRKVAIKVPHDHLIRSSRAGQNYLEEARMVANLDHPNIVPVYDVGTTDAYACFIVSKYVMGADLRRVMSRRRFSVAEAVHLVVHIADALHHAHKRGLVHRDVKPSNILLDDQGQPYITDFGLALAESQVGSKPGYVGTPSYMSPEQARGEGHRVDGRSDIFSLGLVLYELLCGRRAFKASTKSGILEQIERQDPRPLRQHDESIPKELDRICQKAMAKRVSERYWTAHDLAVELREFQESGNASASLDNSVPVEPHDHAADAKGSTIEASGHGSTIAHSASVPQTSSSEEQNVVPKGLRSFDSEDADFFLSLLPGPRDRTGLPENLRFWKSRIESRDVERSFTVGLIYGPSGCGKSSLVQAGLLPRLSEHIVQVTVDCSAEYTEKRLLSALQKNCPGLDKELALPDAVAEIRRGNVLLGGDKILVVLDQFERWLHAQRDSMATADLTRAMRQCDGERVQFILMVRSDFWMAITRLLMDLEVELVQGKNFAAVDLFPQSHAEKVLTAFGRAYGTLPGSGAISQQQEDFVRQSVHELTQNGKVVCVRLSLYAEMMKTKEWTAASLKEIGGAKGVGLSFLEESFGAEANPKNRFHQRGARKVLGALLPDEGTAISDRMLPESELRALSGCASDREFAELFRVLDTELRLISPAATNEDEPQQGKSSSAGEARYYRLTHDYLVASLRTWLRSKQLESRAGRAQLLLGDRAGLWGINREKRYLPSLLEFLRIQFLTDHVGWNSIETSMMSAATRSHGLRAIMVACALLIVGVAGYSGRSAYLESQARLEREKTQAVASRLAGSLLIADTANVGGIIAELRPYLPMAQIELREAFQRLPSGDTAKIHAALALTNGRDDFAKYIFGQLPDIAANRLSPICEQLKISEADTPVDQLAEIAMDKATASSRRLKAAAALAFFDRIHPALQDPSLCASLATLLVNRFPSDLVPLREMLRPIASNLIPYLNQVVETSETSTQVRLATTETLVEFQSDSPDTLFNLLVRSDAQLFPLIFASLKQYPNELTNLALLKITESPDRESTNGIDEQLVREKAIAAIALYICGAPSHALQLLQSTEDKRLQTYLIHWLASHGASPQPLIDELNKRAGKDAGDYEHALLLAIGECASELEASQKQAVAKTGNDLFQKANRAGVQSAARWMLQQLDQTEAIAKAEQRHFVGELENIPPSAHEAGVQSWEDWLEVSSEPDMIKWLNSLKSASQARFLTDADSYLTQLVKTAEKDSPQGEDTEAFGYEDSSSPFGSSLTLDGFSSHPIIANDLPNFGDDFSIGLWVRVKDNAPYCSILSKMDLADGMRGFDIWLDAGKPTLHLKNRFVEVGHPDNRWVKAISSKSIADKDWHHILVVRDSQRQDDNVRIYVDGQKSKLEFEANSLDGPISNAAPLLIGGRQNDYFFRGDACRLVSFQQPLSDETALELYLSELWWIHERSSIATNKSSTGNLLAVQMLNREFHSHRKDYDKIADEALVKWTHRISDLATREQDWYLTRSKQHMRRITATAFDMGASPSDPYYSPFDTKHRRTINRTYGIATRETTVSLWRDFLNDSSVGPATQKRFSELADHDESEAVVGMSWFEAAHFCNWLSGREGIPESQYCYETNGSGAYAVGMRAKPRFWELCGYRLPTQAEWEFACRAGSKTSRFYGQSDDMLKFYGWYLGNSDNKQHAVGLLKPNSWGLFDTHGNAQEWCFDLHDAYPYGGEAVDDEPAYVDAIDNTPRSIRSGAYYDLPRYINAAGRYSYDPSGSQATGLRIAQTLRATP